MKVFLLSIIVVWTFNGERHAGSQEFSTQFPTVEECTKELETLQKGLPENFKKQGALDVEVFGKCEMWGKPVKE